MGEIDRILSQGDVDVVFQPILDLERGETVAVEALVRGPEHSALHRPVDLFAAARAADRVGELDWLCRVTAARRALELGLVAPLTVFINVEPDTLHMEAPAGVDPEALVDAGLRVAVEFTERALSRDPASLVDAAVGLRELGWGVALDDVGAEVRSLALLPVLSPDVIKLDMRLIQQRPDGEVASIVHAVNAYSERTGATILAEGIETEGHVDAARSLGATLGQGWLFGRPNHAPRVELPAEAIPLHRTLPTGDDDSPFDLASPARRPLRGTADLLAAHSRHLEIQAEQLQERPILLASFQELEHFTPMITHRYQRLASRLPFVGVVSQRMPPEPRPGVYGGSVEVHEALARQWIVVVLGPHFAAALVAREVDTSRRAFDFVLTYDRPVVAILARHLMRRLSPRDPSDQSADSSLNELKRVAERH